MNFFERQVQLHAFLRSVRCEYGVTESEAVPAAARGGGAANDPGENSAPSEGVEALQRRNESIFLDILESLNELEERRKRSLDELQQLAVELSVIGASHVIEKDLSEDSHAMDRLVNSAIQRLNGDQPITVHLHPEDLEQLNVMWKSMKAERSDYVQFVADRSLARGTCLAHTPDFGLLSTLDARLAEIRQALLEGIDDAQIERRRTGEAGETVRRFPDRRETA